MRDLKIFRFYCQKVLPLVYDNSLSYYEVLAKVVDYLNKTIEVVNNNSDLLEEHGNKIAELQEELDFLQSEFEKVKNGDYVSLYIDSLANWIDKNLQNLVAKIVRYVFFGLTDDGYFIAYIPESWEFLTFDTIIDTESELYGHLIMRW